MNTSTTKKVVMKYKLRHVSFVVKDCLLRVFDSLTDCVIVFAVYAVTCEMLLNRFK